MPSGISPGGRPIDESPLHKGKPDNWVSKRGGLPPYVRGIARGIAKKHGGKVTSRDIKIAISRVKVLEATSKNPAVKAAAAAASAQWKAMKNLSVETLDTDTDLSWANFDAARGTTPRQAAAQPAATGTVAGYNGPPMSQGTIDAIKAYQKANGLAQTGNLDSATMNMANGSTKAAAAASKKAAGAAKSAANKAAAAKKKAASAAKTAANKSAAASKKVQSAKIAAAKKATAAGVKATKAQTAASNKTMAAANKATSAKKSAANAAVSASNRNAAKGIH